MRYARYAVEPNSGITNPKATAPRRLVEGLHIWCPNCNTLRHSQRDLKVFDRPEEFRMELNPVYQCRRDRKGCGHVFSPADLRIVHEYVAGNLVPIEKVRLLEARVQELLREAKR